jgi:hypothetical protein
MSLLLSFSLDNSTLGTCKDSHSTFTLINHKKILDMHLLDSLTSHDFDTFVNEIKNVIQTNSVTISSKTKFKQPYMNDQIMSYIRIKNNYLKLMRTYPNFSYANNQFKAYRNKVSHLIQEAKKKFVDNFFRTHADDPHKIWSQIRCLLYNKKESPQSCEMLVVNGIAVLTENNIAKNFNNYFSTCVDNLISSNNVHPTSLDNYHSNECYDIVSTFSSPDCTDDELELIINNLSNSKAIDVYGMSNFFLKYHKSALIPNLRRLINDVLSNGCFPDSLKIGIITPIHKGGSKIEISNYRPVTILPVFSKVLENVMLRRIEEHLLANNVMHSNQFGYTKKSNTEIAVVHVLNEVYKGVDEALITALTCLDLSRAFDCVQFDILLLKLHKLRFSSSFFCLLESYLLNRKQATKVNSTVSELIDIRQGVPQGGVLSGFFFIFYVNSINSLNLNSSLFLYCDDISIVTRASEATLLKEYIESDLIKIAEWLRHHFLFPNEGKSKYLIIQNKRRRSNSFDFPLNISFNGVRLEKVEHLRLLGLEIDMYLSFSHHINIIQSRIVAFTFALKRMRRYISESTAKTLYFSYIQSRLMYMNVVWASAPKYIFDALEIVQRKALRIVFCKSRFCSRTELYSDKILSVNDLCHFSSCLLVFKMAKNSAKITIPLRYVNETHRYSTRSNNNFLVPSTRTQFGSSNFFIKAFSDYNNLCNEIKSQVTISAFKCNLRNHLAKTFMMRYSI